nr:MAG TPA: hypothetical protein [Herelleviridae sp.]
MIKKTPNQQCTPRGIGAFVLLNLINFYLKLGTD